MARSRDHVLPQGATNHATSALVRRRVVTAVLLAGFLLPPAVLPADERTTENGLSQTTLLFVRSVPGTLTPPIEIRGYVSPMAPRANAAVIRELRTVLRQLDRLALPWLKVDVEETESFSERAVWAYENLGVRPATVDPGVPGIIPDVYLFGHVFVERGSSRVALEFLEPAGNPEHEVLVALHHLIGFEKKRLGLVKPDRLLNWGIWEVWAKVWHAVRR